ncbi:MAG: acylphosphatase [Mariprofundaceae bacterium]
MLNGNETSCLRIIVSGRVQGVGFRYYTKAEADRLGISGWVRNLSDGNVESLICGSSAQLDTMLVWLSQGPKHARVTGCHANPGDLTQQPKAFTISH